MTQSVVLLSSGLDSTVNLFWAKAQSQVRLALTFDYGQRAADREIQCAAQIAARAGIDHKVLRLEWFREFVKTSLVNRDAAVPMGSELNITDQRASEHSARAVWVPNRNGIFLNIAAGYAEGLGASWIIPGFNAEEASTFPDNTPAFARALEHAFSFSTANHIKVHCFTMDLDKTEIVKKGKDLKVPFELIWPCYFGDVKPCGQCESCQRYSRAIKAAGGV